MIRRLLLAAGALFACGIALVANNLPPALALNRAVISATGGGGGGGPAIAFDNAADLGNNGGSGNLTASYTGATLTNGLMVACIIGGFFGSIDNVTSVTYNGVSLTRADLILTNNSDTRTIYLYYLLNPASGAHNFVVNVSSDWAVAVVAEYSNVKQSAQPDSHNTGIANANTITVADTIVNAGSWGVACGGRGSTSATLSGGTNLTARVNAAGFGNQPVEFDSNGAPGTGSQNFQINSTASEDIQLIVAAFQPG